MERLSGLDSAFLYAEADNAPLNVLAAVVLAPGALRAGSARSQVRRVLAARLDAMPKLRKRRREVPLGLDHPIWEDDRDFDLDWHLRHVSLPAPGGVAQLEAFLGQVAARPLVRSRPLWEAWVVEQFQPDRVVVVFKIHHAVMDGLAGAAALLAFFDEKPHAAPVEGEKGWQPEEPASSIGLAARSLWSSSLRLGVGQVARAAWWTGGAIVAGMLRLAMVGARQSGVAARPFEGPDLSFNKVVSTSRNLGFGVVSLSKLREVARAFDATLNEVVMAVLTMALRRELSNTGECPAGPLVAAIPVGLPRDPDRTENRLSVMLARLPVHEPDPFTQIEIVVRESRAAKSDHEAVGAGTLPSVAQHLWPPLVEGAARVFSETRLANHVPSPVNLVVSNLPGPPGPLYLCGARIEGIYPFGPIFDGVGLNVTVLSYAGALGIGVTAGTESALEASRLASRFVDCFSEFAQETREYGRTGRGRSTSERWATP